MASPDGTKVMLSDGCVYDLTAETCDSVGGTPSGFLGLLGATQDLSTIYFADTEALTPGAQPGTCDKNYSRREVEEAGGRPPTGHGCNIYAYSHGTLSFVATLFYYDNNFGFNEEYGDWKAATASRGAQVTADGRYLTFMSYAPLTGYDNRPSAGICHAGGDGLACYEVFEFDSASAHLTCVSCNPTGAPPLGRSNISLIRPSKGFTPFLQPENLPAGGGGRVFFESQDVLSPADTNGNIQDVYEWTPTGVGGCADAKGCVALISSGHSSSDSKFVNATPSGDDAFFITREQLVRQDRDDFLDVYDARVGGGLGSRVPAPCGAEGCKGAISGPVEAPAGGSAGFTGPGNLAPPPPTGKPKPQTRAQKLAKALKACVKQPKRKRRACQAHARKHYGPLRAARKPNSTNGSK